MNIITKILDLFKPKPHKIIVDSPTDFYTKRHNHPKADSTLFHVGNVVKCRITERKAVLTHITYLPPNRNYMHRFDGIGFDGHGWWSHHICLLGENMDLYLESLKNNERKV